MVNFNFYIEELNRNSKVFESLLNSIPAEQIIWKQEINKWNLLEIICHILDEEKEDFRLRLKLVLENPNIPFPSIDPQSWVTERSYGSQNFENVISEFNKERNNSVEWLRNLKAPKWDNAYNHPKVGPVSAKFLLANWVAHDYLHIRQITKLKYDYLMFISNESLNYAGEW